MASLGLRSAGIGTLATVSILALASPALAQSTDSQSTEPQPAPTTATAPQAPPPAGNETSPGASERPNLQSAASGQVEEIIITAQRRQENLQKVPVAATGLTGDQLAGKGVQQISDLEFAAPSVSITDQGLTQSVNIRGVGLSSGSPAVTNGVATYIDGMFQPPILTTSVFYDIGSIEVLRGPQGTFVGSNSTGGAIFINSQNPSTDRVKGYLQGSYGNYDHIKTEGAVNLPVTGTLAFRVAGNFDRRDSYYTDVGPYDNHPDRLNEKAGRIGMLWNPGNFRVLGKAEWVDRQSGGFAARPIEGTPFAADRVDGIRTVAYNAPTAGHERGFRSTLELRYELDSGVVLRSLSGYLNYRANHLYDLDASRLSFQTQDQFVREREWVQEFNIISPTGGRFDWILGGYYQQNKIDVVIQQRSGSPVDPTDILIAQKKTISGVFGQFGYKVTPELQLQVGARYSHFKGESGGTVTIGNGLPFFPPGGLVVANLAGSHSDGRPTGKIALNWTPNNDNLVYAFVARGYKPGGANSATSEFGPETDMDYEVGWKSSFLGHHLNTQVGAFFMKYKGFQLDAVDPNTGQTGTSNISDASIKGFELQAQARFGGFAIDGGLAFVDSKLKEATIINTRILPAPAGTLGPQCPSGVPSNPPVCFDYTNFYGTAGGGPNLFSPKWSYNIGAQYEAQLGGDMTLTPRLNYAYIGPRWTNFFYSPTTDYLKARGIMTGLLTLRKGNWTLEGYANNLLNKKYVSGQFINAEFYGAPREYGIRAAVRF